jgi:hypothetical protein
MTTAADGLHVRRYQPGDEAAIQRLFTAAFGTTRSDAAWRWQFLDAPAGPAHVIVAVDGPDIVGHCAWCVFDGVVIGRPVRMACGVDLMVDAAHRHRGIAQMVSDARDLFSDEHDVRLQFPGDVTRSLKRASGNTVPVGTLPMWVRWRTARSLAASRGGSVGGPAAAAVLMAARAHARARAAITRVSIEPAADLRPHASEIDALARDAHEWAPAVRTRDAAYLTWRWLEQPDVRWTCLLARRRGRLTGFVVHAPLSPDGTRGCIADLLAADAPTHLALLDAAARRLEAAGVELVELIHVDPRPWARRATWAAGFAPRGVGPNLMVSTLHADAPAAVCQDLGSWYLTAGDTDLV